MRLVEHPVLAAMPERRWVNFWFDGKPVAGYEGEPIAAALWAAGIRTVRLAAGGGGRGLFCGIGHCYECRATVDGAVEVRTCITPLREGMQVGLMEGRVQPQVEVL